jgi:hypothetical protein
MPEAVPHTVSVLFLSAFSNRKHVFKSFPVRLAHLLIAK